MTIHIRPTALIEDGVHIGSGTEIWDHVHIGHSTRIGVGCSIGEKTYIAHDVQIGSRVTIKPLVNVCQAVTIEDDVIICTGTIFTKDRFLRAIALGLKPPLQLLKADDAIKPTLVREGANIGAGSIIGDDLVIGCFAVIGMGSVVTTSVPDFHLAIGHPAISVGCVCRCRQLLLLFSESITTERHEALCSACGLGYAIYDRVVTPLTPPGSQQPRL
jgi:acetyltransferase-like isoleucine patch superfamily enzyme